jgi:hypothetical protein
MGKRIFVRHKVFVFYTFKNIEILSSLSREKFGLFNVNFEDPMRTRLPKASARFFKNIVESNGFKELLNGLQQEFSRLLLNQMDSKNY